MIHSTEHSSSWYFSSTNKCGKYGEVKGKLQSRSSRAVLQFNVDRLFQKTKITKKDLVLGAGESCISWCYNGSFGNWNFGWQEMQPVITRRLMLFLDTFNSPLAITKNWTPFCWCYGSNRWFAKYLAHSFTKEDC